MFLQHMDSVNLMKNIKKHKKSYMKFTHHKDLQEDINKI